MSRVDCKELFCGNETAFAEITGNIVHIKMWWAGDYMEFNICIDKIANFLEQCQRSQQSMP